MGELAQFKLILHRIYTAPAAHGCALKDERESKKDAKHTRAHEDIKAQRSDTIKYTKVFVSREGSARGLQLKEYT
jgi:hypothetical protein